MAIGAKIRVQVNMVMAQTKFNDDIKKFNNLVIPIFFVEIIVEKIPFEVEMMLGMIFKIFPLVQTCLIVIFGVVGVFCLFLAIFLLIKMKVNDQQKLSEDIKVQNDCNQILLS